MNGEHSPCSGQAARSFGDFSPGVALLLPPAGSSPGGQSLGGLSPGAARLFPPLGQPEVCARSLPVRHASSLLGEWPGQPGACVHSPRARRAFSLCGPSARCQLGLRKPSDRNPGLFAVWEGVASLGLSLPFSSPRCFLPPAGMGRLFS